MLSLFTGEKQIIAARLDLPRLQLGLPMCIGELYDNVESSDTRNDRLIDDQTKSAVSKSETCHFG